MSLVTTPRRSTRAARPAALPETDLIIVGDGVALNLRRIVHTEWHTRPARRGQPARRELLITTDVKFTDERGVTGPYLLFLAGEEADRAWSLIQAAARGVDRPAPVALAALEAPQRAAAAD